MDITNNKPSLFFHWKADAISGLVVFLVALPLCLGIALASGAPLFSGMIAGMVGGIVIGVLSKSPVSVCGPAAGLTAIIFSGITSLKNFDVFLLALVIAGVFQILLGIVKAGKFVQYMPHSVIEGMLAAIGVIIILKQYFFVIGLDKINGSIDFTHPHLGVLIIGLVSLASMMLWDAFKPEKLKLIPSAVIGVLVGFFMGIFFQQNENLFIPANHFVNLPISNNIGQFIGQFTLPNFSALNHSQVWIVAITIGLVASIETLLTIKATDEINPSKSITPVNRELIAQGIGNTISGLIGGLPITSVIVRSSANINAGAKSKLSSIIHGILLFLGVLLIPFILNKIPLASLASILLMTGYKLCNPKKIIAKLKESYAVWLPFIITIIGVVAIDLLKGVAIGVLTHLTIHFINKKK